jgi:hypothetical protein
MTFSDIKTKFYALTKTNSSSYPIANVVIDANNAMERVTSLVLHADGRWQFDDTNQTDLPIATTSLVADQQDYAIDTGHLVITRVEVKAQTGEFRLLVPIDQSNISDEAMTQFMSGTGLPMYYDKIGNSIFLYPTPSYSQAASLKVYFQRGPSYFSSGDTTKVPGFMTIYHDLIPLLMAYDYAIGNGKKNAEQLYRQIKEREEALQESYSLRGADDHIRVSPRLYNFR